MANEKRLIDANELKRIYSLWVGQLQAPEDKGDLNGVETCLAVLNDQPTVDAVEVVRCKDCFYNDKICPASFPDREGNDYCSIGRRDNPWK